MGADQGMLLALTETGGLTEMIAVLLVDVILALTDGTLLAFALRAAAVAAIVLLTLYIQKKKPDCFFSRYAA